MYQKFITKISILFVALMLTACGDTLSCDNADVTATLKDFMRVKDGGEEFMQRALDGTTIRQIVTLDSNEKTNAHSCMAVFEYKDAERTVTSDVVEYTVLAVKDDEADFMVQTRGPGFFAYSIMIPWAEQGAAEQRAANDAQYEAERPLREARQRAAAEESRLREEAEQAQYEAELAAYNIEQARWEAEQAAAFERQVAEAELAQAEESSIYEY